MPISWSRFRFTDGAAGSSRLTWFGRWPHWTGGLLLGVLAVVPYLRAANFPFIDYDDYVHVCSNPHLNPPTLQGLGQLWSGPYGSVYIPVAYTWFAGEAALARAPGGSESGAELDARVFHVGGLLLHAMATLTVFALLGSLLNRTGPALLGALLFAWHPLQVESVAWISGTPGLLGGLLALVALWQYVVYMQAIAAEPSVAKRDANGDTSHRPLLHYALATAALVPALLAKPSTVAVPLMAAVLGRGWLMGSWRQIARSLTPWFILALAMIAVTKLAQPGELMVTRSPFWARPLVAGDTIAFYLGKLVFPWNLTPDYGRKPPIAMASTWFYVAWLLPVAAYLWGHFVLSARRAWATIWGLFIAALAPVLGLIPFGHQDISTVADRYMHLALVGPALGFAVLAAARPTRIVQAAQVAVLLLLAGLGFAQTWHWRDTAALAEHGLRINPASAIMYGSRGNWHVRRGEFDEALANFLAATEVQPDNPVTWHRLGHALWQRGALSYAETCFRRAAELVPTYADAHAGLGHVLAAQGRYEEALASHQLALQLAPGAGAHQNVAEILALRGDVDGAIAHYQQALRYDRDDAEIHKKIGDLRTAQAD